MAMATTRALTPISTDLRGYLPWCHPFNRAVKAYETGSVSGVSNALDERD